MITRRRGTLGRMLFSLIIIGLALATAHFEGFNSALMLLGIVVFFEVRHPSFFEWAEDLGASQAPQPQFQQIEQTLYEIKMTLEGMKIDIGEATTELEGVKNKLEEVKNELGEVKTEIAEVSKDLAEVKSTVDDVKNELADEDGF